MDNKAKIHSNAQEVAGLSLAFIDAGEFLGLQSISSVFIAERVLAMDSLAVEEKLPIFLWGFRSHRELETIKLAIGRFVSHNCPLPQPKYKKLDLDTLLCCIDLGLEDRDQWGYLPSPLASPAKESNNDTDERPAIILLKATDVWCYHDIRMMDNAEKRKWFDTMEEAKDNFDACDTASVATCEDMEYWDSYMVSEVKNVAPPVAQPKPEDSKEESDDDDYWNSYDATASKF